MPFFPLSGDTLLKCKTQITANSNRVFELCSRKELGFRRLISVPAVFSFLFARASCCISEIEKLWKQRCVTGNMELVSYVCFKLQFERNALFLFKLPYCFSEFISCMIPQDWILCSWLQYGNSLVLCVNAWFSQSATTWLPGPFEVPATAKWLSAGHFPLPPVSIPPLSSALHCESPRRACWNPTMTPTPHKHVHTFHVPQTFSAGESRKSTLESCQISQWWSPTEPQKRGLSHNTDAFF